MFASRQGLASGRRFPNWCCVSRVDVEEVKHSSSIQGSLRAPSLHELQRQTEKIVFDRVVAPKCGQGRTAEQEPTEASRISPPASSAHSRPYKRLPVFPLALHHADPWWK